MKQKYSPLFKNRYVEKISEVFLLSVCSAFFGRHFYEENKKDLNVSLLREVYTKNNFDSDFLKIQKRLIRVIGATIVCLSAYNQDMVADVLSHQKTATKETASLQLDGVNDLEASKNLLQVEQDGTFVVQEKLLVKNNLLTQE